MKADLSIIIVNWNTREMLLDCLDSIASNAGECEVVVVDNASVDGSAEAVRNQFPNVKIIQCAENLGYARATMAGFRASAGNYVLFLNSDTVVLSGAVTHLVEFLEERSKVAACGPRLVKTDGMIQPFAFGRDPTFCYLLARACAQLGLRAPLHDWGTCEILSVDWVSGACLIVRRSAFEQVAGFDERMFLYFEDNDLCFRLRRAGWEVIYNPQVEIMHVGGASPCGNDLRRKYYDESLLYFYSKHYSFRKWMALRIMLSFHRRCYLKLVRRC